MIEIQSNDAGDMLEVHMRAPVTDGDFNSVLMPALDEAIAACDRVRLLVVLEAGLKDFTFGAMMDDARSGLKHWRGFDRIAVVTEAGGARGTIRAFSVFMPCPVMVFNPDEMDDARRWLRESLGSIHQTDLGGGVLHVQLLGQLDSAVYEEETRDLDAFIRRNDRFRLLLDIREFDGWQGLGGVAEHLKLVRDHAGELDRAAIVGDAGWQRMAAKVGSRILGADAKYFPAEEFEAAKAWLAEGA